MKRYLYVLIFLSVFCIGYSQVLTFSDDFSSDTSGDYSFLSDSSVLGSGTLSIFENQLITTSSPTNGDTEGFFRNVGDLRTPTFQYTVDVDSVAGAIVGNGFFLGLSNSQDFSDSEAFGIRFSSSFSTIKIIGGDGIAVNFTDIFINEADFRDGFSVTLSKDSVDTYSIEFSTGLGITTLTGNITTTFDDEVFIRNSLQNLASPNTATITYNSLSLQPLVEIPREIVFSSGDVDTSFVDNGTSGVNLSVQENTAGVIARVSSDTLDFEPTSYSLDLASLLTGFTINSTTGEITAPNLDFELSPFDLLDTSLLASLTLNEVIDSNNVVHLEDEGYSESSIIFAGGFSTTSTSSQLIYEAGGGTYGTALRIDNVGGQLTFVVSTGSEGDIDISANISVNTNYVYIVEITGETNGSTINLYIAEGRNLSVLDSTSVISRTITSVDDTLSGADDSSYLSPSATSSATQGDGVGSLGSAGGFVGEATPILFFSGQAVDTAMSESGTSSGFSGNSLTLTVTATGSDSSETYSENIVVNILDTPISIAFSSGDVGSEFCG